MRAKKSLGQNFLTSIHVVNAMISAGEVTDSDMVVEIGPGKGIMTKKLLEKAGEVIAIEKDSELVAFLKEKFKKEINSKKLTLIEGDILDYEAQNTNYKIIANIPYYITGAIIRKFLSSNNQPEKMVLLLQREVAHRITKKDNKESILSLSVNVYGFPKIIKKVSPSSFSPSPKVYSSILAINNIQKDNFKNKNTEDGLFKLIHAGFAHKRKILSKNLRALFDEKHIEKCFKECEIESNTRAEDVPLEKWLCINQKS